MSVYSIKNLLLALVISQIALFIDTAWSAENHSPAFRRVQTQFIAALGEPGADSGDNAQSWGLWRQDPGPRGVRLDHFDRLQAADGIAPARWRFDNADWWLEEHGLIMESPVFPLPPGSYLVTGGRDVTTVLTIRETDDEGKRHWELADGASLHDITHLACRSARYTPLEGGNACSPSSASPSAFPVSSGAVMPSVAGCQKQDYAVLFVVGIAVENQYP